MTFEVDLRVALNKLAFGPSAAERHDIAKTGVESWLAQQLKPPAEDDCAARIADTHLRLKYTSKTPEAEVDEERADARLHGGHITRVEQAQLNGDLNAVGREIPR